MASTNQTIRLTYAPGYWTDATISVKVRSLSEPDREVPLMARFVSTPDVLSFAAEKDEHEVKAQVTVKPGFDFPANDKVMVKVIADPASEVAMAATAAAGMLPPGVSLPRPFKNMTADVTVLVFPYQVEYTAVLPDGAEVSVAPGGQLSVPQDGLSKILVKARVFRVNSSGQRASEAPLSGVTGTIKEAPVCPGITVGVASSSEGFALSVASTEVRVGGQPPASITVSFQLAVPSGRRFTQKLVVQAQPLRATMSINPTTLPVGVVRTLEGGKATVKLELETADGRAVPLGWKIDCPLGTCSPASGTIPQSGPAQSTYHPPSPEEAGKAGSKWPRIVTLKALVGPKSVEAAHCDITLTYQLSVHLLIEKVGFDSLKKELEVTALGPCKLHLVTKVGEKLVPVAHASVSGQGCPATTTDTDGYCTLDLGQGNQQNLGNVTLQVTQDVRNFQKQVVDGLKQSAGASPAPAYVKAQTDLTQFVEVAYVERLAKEEVSDFDVTNRVMIALLGCIKVMNMARSLFLRRFDRVEANLKTTLQAVLTALWDLLLGDLFTKALKWVAGTLLAAVKAVVNVLGSFRVVRFAASGVVWVAQGLQNAFVNFYQKIFNKVQRLFDETHVPQNLKDRLVSDPSRGPVPLSPGSISSTIKAELAKAVELLKGELDQLKEALKVVQANLASNQAAIREIEETIARHQGKPGTQLNLEAQLASLRLQGAKIEGDLAQVSGKLQKTQLELTDVTSRNTTLGMLADELDTLVNLIGGLLNMVVNILLAVTLSLAAVLLKAIQPAMRQAGVTTALLERLAKLLEDIVGDLLSNYGTDKGSKSGATEILKKRLLATQRCLAASALADTYTKLKEWPEIDRDKYKEAVSFYYESIEHNEFRSEASEVMQDFLVLMIDWLEWLVIWTSRLAVLFASVVALLASAGTAVPAVGIFALATNEAIELIHKFYVGIKAGVHAADSMASLALAVGVALPGHVEFTVRVFADDKIRDNAAAPLTLPSMLMDPDFRRAVGM